MLNLKNALKDGSLEQISRRNIEIDKNEIKKIVEDRSSILESIDKLRQEINEASKKVSQGKMMGICTDEIIDSVKTLKGMLRDAEKKSGEILDYYDKVSLMIPNAPEETVPNGKTDEDNVEIKRWGFIPCFSFVPKNHIELNEKIKVFDFERGVKLSGRGFYLYVNEGALLERALLNYMIDVNLKDGRNLVMHPYIIAKEALTCTAQLPKFEEDLFKVGNNYLISTSEIPLISMHMKEILDLSKGPIRSVACTQCFRKEAGSAGVDGRGIIRSHQFNKVEMTSICKEEEYEHEFKIMLNTAEKILQSLNIPYRILELCTGDLPFASKRTYDIEVWMPGQGRYYECSSISWCGDFQSRRGQIRYTDSEGNIKLAHALNGSGIASSRLMVALLENNQDEKGNIHIPEVLQKYLGFGKINIK